MYTDEQIGTLEISGDPARFVATEKVPISGLTMDFEPVQDLHGYEYPWPAGGGKNLFDLPDISTTTKNGVTYSVKDGVLTINGTCTGEFQINPTFLTALSTGAYVASVRLISGSTGGVNNSFNMYSSSNTRYIASFGTMSYPALRLFTDDVATCSVVINANAVFNNAVLTFQLESGTTATDFAPYSNICPITGRDSVNVCVSPTPEIGDGTEIYNIEFPTPGVNQWDEQWENGTFDTATGANINNQTTNQQIRSKNLIPIKGGVSYYFLAYPSIWCMFYDENMNIITPTASGHQMSNKSIKLGTGGDGSPVYSVPSDAKYFKFYAQMSYGATYNNDISINYPSTDTSYHAYVSPIVYQGTLTINEDGTGQIVATYGKHTFDGSDTVGLANWKPTEGTSAWLYAPSVTPNLRNIYTDATNRGNLLCDTLKTVPYNTTSEQVQTATIPCISVVGTVNWGIAMRVNDTSLTTASAINAYLANNPIEIVYKLATPVTIQLDPIEITTLIGLNYVWSSQHNLITLTFPYRKEIQPMEMNYNHCWTYPKAVIDKLIKRIEDLEDAVADLEAASGEAKTAPETIEKENTEPVEETVTETRKGGK